MNIVDSLIRRYSGFESLRDYDIALSRLKCYHYDVYRGITPNTEAPDFNPEPPVFACRFSNTPGYEHVLALANEDGKVALQNTKINVKTNNILEGTQCHCNAIFDVAWMPGEMKLVTASGDHAAKLWDISGSEIKFIDCFNGHTRSIKTAVFRPSDNAVFATGARDGAIMVWDIRATNKKADNCILNGHSIGPTCGTKSRRSLTHASRAQSITSLAFQDDNTLFSCAAGDGIIKAWDLRKNYTVHKKEPVPKHALNYSGGSTRNGFTSLLICPGAITLYASCMDNMIYAYNVSSYNPRPFAEYYGHQNSTFYVKSCLSPDGRYLASGSSDENAYIWKTSKPGEPMFKLSGHTEEVTCIAWCSYEEPKLVTCSDDSFHRIWRVGLEHKQDNDEIELRGQAETVNKISSTEQLLLETTPTSSNRRIRQEYTPGSDITTGTPSNSETEHDNDGFSIKTSGSFKRSRDQMMSGERWTDGKFQFVLSPIKENVEPLAKRPYLENRGPRRLFSPIRNDSLTKSGYESDEPIPCSSKTADDRQMPFSPTLNLPNFVIDGTAPHLINRSPIKLTKDLDWLTKIRKIRYEGKEEGSDSPNVTSLNSITTTTPTTTTIRSRRSKSSEPRRVKPAVSMLNFFKKR